MIKSDAEAMWLSETLEYIHPRLEIGNLPCIGGFGEFFGQRVRKVGFRDHRIRDHLHVIGKVLEADTHLVTKYADVFLRLFADRFDKMNLATRQFYLYRLLRGLKRQSGRIFRW